MARRRSRSPSASTVRPSAPCEPPRPPDPPLEPPRRRVDFPPGWSFPCGTGRVTSVALFARGAVLPDVRAADALAEVGVPLSLAPLGSVCWHGLSPSNSYVFGWDRARANRDADAPADARVELFRNGDSAVTLNGATTLRRRVPPFACGGIGQDADWVAANFTNAAEITSAGYAGWVAGRVAAGRGLYRLRVTFAAPPPEDVLLSVGRFRVLVRGAGDFDFPLGKGARHAVALSFVPDGVSYSWDDGGAADAAARSAPSRSVAFTASGSAGRTLFEPPAGPGAEGFILWVPALAVSADGPEAGFPVRFRAHADLPCPYEVEWLSDDGSVEGRGDDILIREPGTWRTVSVTVRHPGGELHGSVTARRFVGETRILLGAPGAVVFERARADAPGGAVPLRSSGLRATASWAAAEAGTVRLSCEPGGAFEAVSDGAAASLPCEWRAAKDGVGSREIALAARDALAEAGDAAKLTLSFEPDGGGAVLEETAEIRAYELRVEAAASWPTNRARHVFGPLEEARLTITPNPTSVAWNVEDVESDDLEFTWTAKFKPAKSNGNVTVDGATFDFNFDTIAPERLVAGGFRAMESWDRHTIAFDFPEEGEIGVGLIITNITLLPDWVSFGNVEIKEGVCLATNMWGVFDFEGAAAVLPPHGSDAGAERIMSVGFGNIVGDDAAALAFTIVERPWKSGGFRYDIPLYWRAQGSEDSDSWNSFGTTAQSFTLTANGDLTVSKLGGSATRGTNGVSRITIRKEN